MTEFPSVKRSNCDALKKMKGNKEETAMSFNDAGQMTELSVIPKIVTEFDHVSWSCN